MKSPPPMPPPPLPPPPPPPSYQESLKQMQHHHAHHEMPNQYAHHGTELNSDFANKYTNNNRPNQYLNTSQNNRHFNDNSAFSNENSFSTSSSPSIPSSASNDDMRNFLKTQQQQQNTNNSNKRDLSQYLNSCQQPYKNILNSEFLRHNSPVNNFIAHQNYTSTKRPATNFTSDIEKELSDLTLTIEREMERQMEDKSEYFGLCAKCNKGSRLRYCFIKKKTFKPYLKGGISTSVRKSANFFPLLKAE